MKKALLTIAIFSSQALAGGQYGGDPGGHHGHGDPWQGTQIDNHNRAYAYAAGVGIGKGYGYGGTANAQGASSNTTVSGVGNTSVNYPRQTPFAYSPGLSTSFSQQNCTSSASLGVSAPFGAIGGGVPINDEGCQRRLDTMIWQQANMPKVACNRMLIDSDENQQAMKNAGVSCNNIENVAVAVPTVGPQVVSTPVLDEYVKRKEVEEMLDNQHLKAMGK